MEGARTVLYSAILDTVGEAPGFEGSTNLSYR